MPIFNQLIRRRRPSPPPPLFPSSPAEHVRAVGGAHVPVHLDRTNHVAMAMLQDLHALLRQVLTVGSHLDRRPLALYQMVGMRNVDLVVRHFRQITVGHQRNPVLVVLCIGHNLHKFNCCRLFFYRNFRRFLCKTCIICLCFGIDPMIFTHILEQFCIITTCQKGIP